MVLPVPSRPSTPVRVVRALVSRQRDLANALENAIPCGHLAMFAAQFTQADSKPMTYLNDVEAAEQNPDDDEQQTCCNSSSE